VSAILPPSLVAIVVIYTEVRPFRTITEKSVPVDIVVADDTGKKKPDPLVIPPPSPSPTPDFSLLKAPLQTSPQSAAPQTATPPSSSAARGGGRETAQSQQQATTALSQAPQAAAPGYSQPEPDLTVKYHVMLGLPQDLPAPASASSGGTRGDGSGDATPATETLASSLVELLRRHLKTCSKLPAALSPSDNVAVKLRVQMAPDGRLAAEPALIEGSASLKGVELMRGAIAALAACQPYAMLPADRYGEWKVLDLSFTPRDFNS
jgi:hypothetical protein